jgi:hypothetical protein
MICMNLNRGLLGVGVFSLAERRGKPQPTDLLHTGHELSDENQVFTHLVWNP